MNKKEYEYLKLLGTGSYLFIVNKRKGVRIESLFFDASAPVLFIENEVSFKGETDCLSAIYQLATAEVLRVLTKEEVAEYKETVNKLAVKFLEKG